MLTVFTSLACYPGAPLPATETRLAWAGIGEDCRPRTTWWPLTLFGQPGSPSFATPWRSVPRQDVNSSFPPLRVPPQIAKVFAHTQSPPPPVLDLPWGPHPPGHQASNLSSSEETVFFVSFHFLQTDLFLEAGVLWMILFSAEAIFASSTSNSGIRILLAENEEFTSSMIQPSPLL